MKIEPKQISIRDLVTGYSDSGEEGVVAFAGLLDIRPPYQREFVYKDEQRDRVIDTVRKGYPLNVMYWVKNTPQPSGGLPVRYEVLDGQQRTISICRYINGDFSIDEMYFHNQPADIQERILSYEVTVYECEGTDSEKLEWFKTINIAGEKLTDQELRNAIYAGPWLTNAKQYFSRTNCPAYQLAENYVSGSPIRQEFLETALEWISEGKVENYMASHQNDPTAYDLWAHFSRVIEWVKSRFPVVRKTEMRSVNWGELYRNHGQENLDPVALEKRIKDLMQDEDIRKKSGIYAYVLTGDERHLNLRAFPDSIKRAVYEKQEGRCANGECPKVGHRFKIDEMEADHRDPWHAGGKTDEANCQMLCKPCNRRKGGI